MANLQLFAGAVDGAVESSSAAYADAVAGTGTAALAADAAGLTLAVVSGIANNNSAATYICTEAFISFDLSTLPPGCIVRGATLSLYHNASAVDVAFTAEVRTYDWGAGVTTADWVGGASLGALPLLASLASTAFAATQYNAFASLPTLAAALQAAAGGTLRMIINNSLHRLATAPGLNVFSNIIFQSADTALTTQDPKLDIFYEWQPVIGRSHPQRRKQIVYPGSVGKASAVGYGYGYR